MIDGDAHDAVETSLSAGDASCFDGKRYAGAALAAI